MGESAKFIDISAVEKALTRPSIGGNTSLSFSFSSLFFFLPALPFFI
jgi:hypothetical protein